MLAVESQRWLEMNGSSEILDPKVPSAKGKPFKNDKTSCKMGPVPPMELTYPSLGKAKSSSKVPLGWI